MKATLRILFGTRGRGVSTATYDCDLEFVPTNDIAFDLPPFTTARKPIHVTYSVNRGSLDVYLGDVELSNDSERDGFANELFSEGWQIQ